VNDDATYYASVAGAAFSIFILGAGLVATRFSSLAERTAALKRERGDFLNMQVTSQNKLHATWSERGRTNELADLHLLVHDLRRAILVPLIAALGVAPAALLPLIGWPDDSTGYRLVLLLALMLVIVLWLRAILRIADAVSHATQADHDARQRQRDLMKGESFFVSGDPRALVAALERTDAKHGVEPPSWRRHPLRRYRFERFRRSLSDETQGLV
jgi:hypothetical protein